MSRIVGLAAWLLPLSVGWGAAAMTAGNDGPAEAKHVPAKLPACAISVEHRAGSIVLEGEVFAAGAVSGSYQLKIWQHGAGSSAISQGGDFAMPAGGSSSLGMVSLSKGAGSYAATLKVNWDDDPVDCKATAHAPMPTTSE
jgi:hypothetical protein